MVLRGKLSGRENADGYRQANFHLLPCWFGNGASGMGLVEACTARAISVDSDIGDVELLVDPAGCYLVARDWGLLFTFAGVCGGWEPFMLPDSGDFLRLDSLSTQLEEDHSGAVTGVSLVSFYHLSGSLSFAAWIRGDRTADPSALPQDDAL
jgi:hypothetical protein